MIRTSRLTNVFAQYQSSEDPHTKSHSHQDDVNTFSYCANSMWIKKTITQQPSPIITSYFMKKFCFQYGYFSMRGCTLSHYLHAQAYLENWQPLDEYCVLSIKSWEKIKYGIIITVKMPLLYQKTMKKKKRFQNNLPSILKMYAILKNSKQQKKWINY